MGKRTCTIDGCEHNHLARGWCNKHYHRWQRHGDPLVVVTARHETEIHPGDVEWNFWSHVQKTDTCWNWLGALWRGHGKFKHPRRRAPVQAHRFSYELVNGPIPEGLEIDHICHNRRCVNPDHLRVVTSKQNKENHSGFTSRSTSGIRGVHWDKRIQKWTASVGHNYTVIHVGTFESKAEAEAAVIAKRNELHTHNDLDRM